MQSGRRLAQQIARTGDIPGAVETDGLAAGAGGMFHRVFLQHFRIRGDTGDVCCRAVLQVRQGDGDDLVVVAMQGGGDDAVFAAGGDIEFQDQIEGITGNEIAQASECKMQRP